ncbi:hypothetical protein ASPWEDRAFT_187265 [Aspergillus wentii DTO 134E9]|uniref:Major facilitator superfamily (MFS) profile domain-containing protein n=1 Tax=Aspergillus wentii DTO 134E9 TaxID=1073089 RepID=A0A1L9R923_ASPWE|nr:uncharacterized protein ASPWEDRAFT_187265 [Aspergillus wentii DTO 134E9]KAI9926567.1 hypothetical protein MW887_004335 [Aspergillus wentii]OJJ31383.1 hypothetical protein ASPWEDRAFT_187265 [Aspergillus wentii DTO 134E9]
MPDETKSAPKITNHTREDDDTSDFPDGGWRAWSVAFGSWCGMVPAFGLLNSIGVLEAWLAKNELKQYSEGTVGWIFSIFTFFLYATGIQIGPVFDAYGLKYILIPGCTGLVLALMLFSLCHEYYQFILAFSLLGGTTASMIITPSIACITHWFYHRRGLALGLAATAGGFGGIIFPIIIHNLIHSVGFPWAIRIIGFIAAAFGIVCCLLLRTRLPPKKADAIMDLKALTEPRFAMLSVAITLIDLGLLIPLTYLPSYALDHDMDPSLAYQLSSILNGASILGRALPGYFADKYGRLNVVLITAFFCAVFTLGLWLPIQSNTAGIVAYTVLYGFWSGSAISLPPVCIAQLCETEDYGKRYGTTYSLVSIGALVAVPIAGAILQSQDGDYWGVILFCGLAYVVSFVLFCLVRGMSSGWGVMHKF